MILWGRIARKQEGVLIFFQKTDGIKSLYKAAMVLSFCHFVALVRSGAHMHTHHK